MGTNALLAILPLLASGFLFNSVYWRLRSLLSHADGQRVFFASAISGVVVTSLAYTLSDGLLKGVHLDGLIASPFDNSGAVIVSLVLATFLGVALNTAEVIVFAAFQGKGQRLKEAVPRFRHSLIRQHGNPLRGMLVDALGSRKAVMLSLKSRKVYVGQVVGLSQQSRDGDQFVEIIPFFSDCRHKDDLSFCKRTDYPPVHSLWVDCRTLAGYREILRQRGVLMNKIERQLVEHFIAELETKIRDASKGMLRNVDEFDISDWIKILPLSELESASFYDEEAHVGWFRGEPMVGAEAEGPDPP